MEMEEQERAAAEAIQLGIERLLGLGHVAAPVEVNRAMVVAFSWWAHTVWTACAVRSLREVGLGHEASPLVRTVVDHAASVMWIAMDPKKALAAHDWFEKSKAFSIHESAKKAGWDLKLDEVPEKPVTKAPAEVQYIRTPEELMGYLGNRDLYMAFAYESAFAHATIRGIAHYVPKEDEERGLRADPRGDGTPLRVVVKCLILATDALGNLSQDERFTALAQEMNDLLLGKQIP